MAIEIVEVTSRRQLRKFIYLPEKLHREHRNWLPPVYMDEWKFYHPKKNRAHAHCDTTLALAYRDGVLCGRIMGIIHHAFNREWKQRDARFFNLDCIESREVAGALIAYVEEWAAARGMTHVNGPYGFSDKDPQGALIEGFDELPLIAAPCNFEYLPALIEAAGYKPHIHWVEYKFPIPGALPDLYPRVCKRVMRSGKYRVLDFRKKREIRPYILPVFRLINESFEPLYGFARMSEAEMKSLARQYWPVLDPRFVKIVLCKDEVVGVVIAIPSPSTGIRQARGRLLPFGIFTLKKHMKKTRQLDLMIGAIREEHRGRGIDVLLATQLIDSAREAGMEWIDSHLELEDNHKIRAEMERLGGKVTKRFRSYRKKIEGRAPTSRKQDAGPLS